MSCDERKMVLRVELPELKGKSIAEVYPTYKKLLGEPEDVDEYDGEIEYFMYKGVYQSVYDYCSEKWGIDLVLHHESDYRKYIERESDSLSLQEFQELANKMAQRFGIDAANVKLYSYTWYNGGDEPISFD